MQNYNAEKIGWENVIVLPPPKINVVYLPFRYFPEAARHSETLNIGSGKGKHVVFWNILSSIEAQMCENLVLFF